MKSPAFQWYAADYLADERVMLMTLAAEGAYVRLLSLCWREGSIPSNPALLAAMCKQADPKVIKEVLPCFTKVGAPSGRLVHKRLEEERGKQEAYRAKQAEKGAKGGRPRKEDSTPEKPAALPQLSSGLTGEKPDESPQGLSSISSTSSSRTTDVVPPAATGYPQANEEEPTFTFDSSFFCTDKWLAVCADVRKAEEYAEVNFEHYRQEIRLADTVTPQVLPNRHWRKKLMNWLKNDLAAGKLVKPVATSQPKGKVASDEITFELNPTAVARRRRESEEMERNLIAANLERINRKEGTSFTVGQFLGIPTA